MIPFAETALLPDAVLAWAVVGLLVALLAREPFRSRLGLVRDMGVGLAGALLAGLLFSLVVRGATGFVGSVMAAFLGACLCLALFRGLTARPPRS
jgi:uncharacterized membrane protein YeaQ/YmgE (transglycosylase-associated protein family)